jgi:hypothetical protein
MPGLDLGNLLVTECGGNEKSTFDLVLEIVGDKVVGDLGVCKLTGDESLLLVPPDT